LFLDKLTDDSHAWSKYSLDYEPITQSDKLSITRVSGNRQTRTVTTYDKNDQITTATLQTEYVLLSDEESLEIHVHIDAYECTSSNSSTNIDISISDVSSIVPASRLAALAETAHTCMGTDNCQCITLEPESLIDWPVDECNTCVLQKDNACESMGGNFADQGITYMLYINNTEFVGSNTVGVVKLKNSRTYDSTKSPSTTGVKYPHLSIRDYNKPTCFGCYTANRDGVANFTNGACTACKSDNLRIFFFQLTAETVDGGEIVGNGDGNALAVNFEFSIESILYVTPITKPLARVNTNNMWTNVHNSPNVLPDAGNVVRWPQQVEIHRKQFGIVCSIDSPYRCPYEGDTKTNLAILATAETDPTITTYTFRTIAGGKLYVRLDSFNVGLCSMASLESTFLACCRKVETTCEKS